VAINSRIGARVAGYSNVGRACRVLLVAGSIGCGECSALGRRCCELTFDLVQIVMCILVTRAPTSKMTKSALEELDALAHLFQDASSSCRFAANLLVGSFPFSTTSYFVLKLCSNRY
jgi:hypothetical protein